MTQERVHDKYEHVDKTREEEVKARTQVEHVVQVTCCGLTCLVVTLTCLGAQAAVSSREAAKTRRRMVIWGLAANNCRAGCASAAFEQEIGLRLRLVMVFQSVLTGAMAK